MKSNCQSPFLHPFHFRKYLSLSFHGWQKTIKVGIASTILVALMFGQVVSQDRVWQANDYWWDANNNWSPAGMPGTNDAAIFNSTGDIVWFRQDHVANKVHSSNGSYRFYAGYSDPHSLTLSSTAADSFWTNYRTNVQGIHVNTAGGVQVTGSQGELTFDGSRAGGAWLTTAGNVDVNAEMIFDNNATGNFNSSLFVGNQATDSGQFSVTDGSSVRSNTTIYAGNYGTGDIMVSNGGQLASRSWTTIGQQAGSDGTGTVTGAGSNWTVEQSAMYVGTRSNGTLNILDGGVVDSQGGFIGYSGAGNGTVNVSGVGSTWNNGSYMRIGQSGTTGELNIEDSGLVSVAGIMTLYSGATVNLDGGTLEATSFDASQGTFSMIDGELRVDSFTGDLDVQGGTLAPGNSPGITAVVGNLDMTSASTLAIELGGVSSGEYDMLDISGDFDLGANLDVSLYNGFELSDGQEFVIAEIDGTLNGAFVGLGEGDLVGRFGSHRLHVTYAAGDGNDIALLSSIPEPTIFPVIGFGLTMMARRRKRK